MAKGVIKMALVQEHRGVVRDRHAARRIDQGDAVVALARLEIEADLRALDERIAEYEEVVARLPEELPWKAGQRRLKIGSFSMDLVLSTKPELRALLGVLRERREALAGVEGARRIRAAEGLRAELAKAPVLEQPAEHTTTPATPPKGTGSKWG